MADSAAEREFTAMAACDTAEEVRCGRRTVQCPLGWEEIVGS